MIKGRDGIWVYAKTLPRRQEGAIHLKKKFTAKHYNVQKEANLMKSQLGLKQA